MTKAYSTSIDLERQFVTSLWLDPITGHDHAVRLGLGTDDFWDEGCAAIFSYSCQWTEAARDLRVYTWRVAAAGEVLEEEVRTAPCQPAKSGQDHAEQRKHVIILHRQWSCENPYDLGEDRFFGGTPLWIRHSL